MKAFTRAPDGPGRLGLFRLPVVIAAEAVLNALTGTLDVGIPYPLPTSNSMPSQETTPSRPPVP